MYCRQQQDAIAVVELWACEIRNPVDYKKFVLKKNAKLNHIIKFYKVPKLFFNRKVRVVGTTQL